MRKRYWLIIASILVLGVVGCNSSDNDSPTEPTSYPVCPTDVTRRWDEPYELSVDFGVSNATQTIVTIEVTSGICIYAPSTDINSTALNADGRFITQVLLDPDTAGCIFTVTLGLASEYANDQWVTGANTCTWVHTVTN